jgi:hypothetical protein
MNLTRDRVRSIGWAFVLTVCAGLLLGLTFRVNAVKSQVRLAERQVVALRHEKLFLETEFEARSNQQQLKALNDVEFGYEAPRAEQYIEGERQLAALGKPRAPGAPEPIQVASAADDTPRRGFPAMVSPLTGEAMAAEVPEGGARRQIAPVNLEQRLARINLGRVAKE